MAGLAKEDGVAVSTEALASDFFRVLADHSRRLARGATHDTRDLATALVALLQQQEQARLSAHQAQAAAHPEAYATAASAATILSAQLVASCESPGSLRVVANWLSGAAHDVLAQARAASPASVPCPQPPHV